MYARTPETLPDHALPALGTRVYWLHRIPDARWQQLLMGLAQQGLACERPTTQTLSALHVKARRWGSGFPNEYTIQDDKAQDPVPGSRR